MASEEDRITFDYGYIKDLPTEKQEKVKAILTPMELTDEVLQRIRSVFEKQMTLANSPDPNVRKKSDHLMMNTHLRELLDGTEQGDYLGLDLGGTNFRVVLVRFSDGVAQTTTQYYKWTTGVLVGPAAGVFNFIAECINDFLIKYDLMDSKTKIPLGFTFSFPSIQLALNKCTLVTWTKSFKCPDGVGEDPVAMLEAAINKVNKNMPVEILVICNDTVTTLMAGNYQDKRTRIGLILGTGCNAAFVENISEIEKWTGDDKDPKHVIVNVECGATGDNGCMDFFRSEFERDVDKYSTHPGSFTFEKSFSGMYLGEFVRLVLVRLVQDAVLLAGQDAKLLQERWNFPTAHVTSIESDKGAETQNTRETLKQFHLDPTHEDVAIVRQVASFLSRRGAHIAGAAMSVLVNHVGLPEMTIAVDGSLYEKHPNFHNCMMEMFRKYSPQTKVSIILAKDGSGQGGAFAAVTAQKQNARGIRCS